MTACLEANRNLETPRADEAWQILDDGLEHRATGYFIEREAVAARRDDGLWRWPLQMAEKNWCEAHAFRAAFLAALGRYGIPRDADLARSFAAGFGVRAGEAVERDGFAALGDLVRPGSAACPPTNPKAVNKALPKTVGHKAFDARSAGHSRGSIAPRREEWIMTGPLPMRRPVGAWAR